MKQYYLDPIFRLNTTNHGNEDWPIWEDTESFFTGKCKAVVECYRVIPEGMSWFDESTGTTYEGFMITPAVSIDVINALQNAYEEQQPAIEALKQESTMVMLAITDMFEMMIGGM